jgi:hypothetical protein
MTEDSGHGALDQNQRIYHWIFADLRGEQWKIDLQQS